MMTTQSMMTTLRPASRRSLLLLLCVASLLPACAKRVESTPGQAAASLEAYYPLAVGNRWTYALNGAADKPVEVSIVKEEGGYFHDSRGSRLAHDAFGLRDGDKRYLLRGPLEVGRTWTSIVSVSSTERYRITATGVPCTVPAGEFQDCVEVEGRTRGAGERVLAVHYTFAPRVGLVRIETVLEEGKRQLPQVKLELASYALAAPRAP
jgi:hypothetical protein